MIAGVKGRLNVARPLRVPRQRVKINNAVIFLTFTNPFVHRLTRFLLLWTIVVVERRIHALEGVLERRQRRADNADVAGMGLSDQLPVAHDQIVHGNGRIGRGQNPARPTNIVYADHYHDGLYPWDTESV